MRHHYILPIIFCSLCNCLLLKAQFGSPIGVPKGRAIREVKLIDGHFKNLLNIKTIAINYDYTQMVIGRDSLTEKEYLKDKKGEFLETWNELPKKHIEPRFHQKFAELMGKAGVNAFNYSVSKSEAYLLVTVLKEDPEYHHTPFKDIPPYIELNCTFFDVENNSLVSCNVRVHGSHEKGIENKLGECYSIAGAILAKKIVKELGL
jgi:hypothetical protein